jgi:serpin B
VRLTSSLALFLATALLAAACGAADSEVEPELLGADVPRAPAEAVGDASLAAGLNRFGLDYYGVLASRAPAENLVFSPLSIGMAFGMADAGARGETAAQIEEVFHLPGSGDEQHAAFNALDQALGDAGESTLRLANRMYPASGYELVPDFVQTLGAS